MKGTGSGNYDEQFWDGFHARQSRKKAAHAAAPASQAVPDIDVGTPGPIVNLGGCAGTEKFVFDDSDPQVSPFVGSLEGSQDGSGPESVGRLSQQEVDAEIESLHNGLESLSRHPSGSSSTEPDASAPVFYAGGMRSLALKIALYGLVGVAAFTAGTILHVRASGSEQREKAAFSRGVMLHRVWKDSVTKSPGQIYISGINGKSGEKWNIPVDVKQYLDLRSSSHDVSDSAKLLDFVVVDSYVKETAKRITAGAADKREAAQMVFDYVAQNIVAVDRKPQPQEGNGMPPLRVAEACFPLETLVNRAGSDIDIAVLLTAFNKAAGLQAYIVHFRNDEKNPSYAVAGVDLQGDASGIQGQPLQLSGGRSLYLLMSQSPDGSTKPYFGGMPHQLKGRRAVILHPKD